jgi:hypothetical protein
MQVVDKMSIAKERSLPGNIWVTFVLVLTEMWAFQRKERATIVRKRKVITKFAPLRVPACIINVCGTLCAGDTQLAGLWINQGISFIIYLDFTTFLYNNGGLAP